MGLVKDVQVALATHPTKMMKLNILVANILASYGILISRSFCRDLGREIKMDRSHAIIPVGTKKIKLDLEEKAKFTVMKSNDLKAQILYQEMELDNYMLNSLISVIKKKCQNILAIRMFRPWSSMVAVLVQDQELAHCTHSLRMRY